jgi:hypothetical protein
MQPRLFSRSVSDEAKKVVLTLTPRRLVEAADVFTDIGNEPLAVWPRLTRKKMLNYFHFGASPVRQTATGRGQGCIADPWVCFRLGLRYLF